MAVHPTLTTIPFQLHSLYQALHFSRHLIPCVCEDCPPPQLLLGAVIIPLYTLKSFNSINFHFVTNSYFKKDSFKRRNLWNGICFTFCNWDRHFHATNGKQRNKKTVSSQMIQNLKLIIIIIKKMFKPSRKQTYAILFPLPTTSSNTNCQEPDFTHIASDSQSRSIIKELNAWRWFARSLKALASKYSITKGQNELEDVLLSFVTFNSWRPPDKVSVGDNSPWRLPMTFQHCAISEDSSSVTCHHTKGKIFHLPCEIPWWSNSIGTGILMSPSPFLTL